MTPADRAKLAHPGDAGERALMLHHLPTSPDGLAVGKAWNDKGTLRFIQRPKIRYSLGERVGAFFFVLFYLAVCGLAAWVGLRIIWFFI